MQEQQISPNKITKPIQLLAAWLLGLVCTNTAFLTIALKMESGSWERGALVVAAILNVPGFVWALFTLQTRFRAELQDDSHYAAYLSKKTSSVLLIDKNVEQDAKIEGLERQVSDIAARSPGGNEGKSVTDAPLDWSGWAVALNEHREDFQEIRAALREARIPLAEVFGEESGVPEKWIVSLNRALPIANKARILNVLLPFKFDGIQLWTPVPDADEYEDVYIGSYGSQDSYTEVADELHELLRTEIEDVDLRRYCRKHRVRKKSRILEENPH